MRVLALILRGEALGPLLGGVARYLAFRGHPLWLLPLLLAPDLSMVGYLGPRIGAITYNLVHNWILAAALLALGWWLPVAGLALAGAIVLAHVGMDRTLGYRLKLPTDFRDTHLGRIGR